MIKDLIFDKNAWPACIDTLERAQDMREQLVALEESLNQQIIRHRDEDPQWYRKAKGLLAQVRWRMTQTNAAIKHFNRERTATVSAMEAKWADFAEDLALALDEADSYMLSEIKYRDMTAGEWLDKRIANREKKMEKKNA